MQTSVYKRVCVKGNHALQTRAQLLTSFLFTCFKMQRIISGGRLLLLGRDSDIFAMSKERKKKS